MIIRSPSSRTPALKASAQASTVPAHTGVPAGRPVSAAACAVTVPITSSAQASRGSGIGSATRRAHSSCQPPRVMSYIGAYWLAV